MEDTSQWLLLLRALGSLAVVVLTILAAAWFFRRYFRPDQWGMQSFGQIKVLQTMPIGTKKKLLLVEVDEKRMLLGVGSDTIRHICELDPRSNREQLPLTEERPRAM